MSKFKANNYEQAFKELNHVDEEQGKKLSDEINHTDRKHYHVIQVKIEDQPGQAKNKVTHIVSKLHKSGFERIEKNFLYLGINKLILLHDPSKLNEDDQKVDKPETQQEMIDRLVAEGIAKGTKVIDPATSEELMDKAFEDAMKKNATVPSIDDFAKEYGIKLGEAGNKTEKQTVIKNWFDQKEV